MIWSGDLSTAPGEDVIREILSAESVTMTGAGLWKRSRPAPQIMAYINKQKDRSGFWHFDRCRSSHVENIS